MEENVSLEEICPGCAYEKMKRSPFSHGRMRAQDIGQLVHSDVCGPMQAKTPNGSPLFCGFQR